MRYQIWFAVAALVAVTAGCASDGVIRLGGREFATSGEGQKEAPTKTSTDPAAAATPATPTPTLATTEKKRPLGAYLPRGWFWAGLGDLSSSKMDGRWSSVEGGVNLTDRDQLYLGWSDNTGTASVPGATTKYRWTGGDFRGGWQMVTYNGSGFGVLTETQDEFRLAGVVGKDNGSNPSGYRQSTDWIALELRLARTWYAHHRTWFPGGSFEFLDREELNSSKDSFFGGNKLTRAQDPIDGPGVRHVQLAPELVHTTFRDGKSRLSLAGVYERQWWEDQAPRERDLYAFRIRWTHRDTASSGQGNLDVMLYEVESSKGLMFGLSWSF